VVLNNLGQDDLTEVKIGAKNLAPGMSIHEFPGIASLPAGSSQTVSLGVNFNDTTQSAKFDLVNSL
jgi:AP-3 complex subunit beta